MVPVEPRPLNVSGSEEPLCRFGMVWQFAHWSGVERYVAWFTWARWAPTIGPVEFFCGSTGGDAVTSASAPEMPMRFGSPWQPEQLAAMPFACWWQVVQVEPGLCAMPRPSRV